MGGFAGFSDFGLDCVINLVGVVKVCRERVDQSHIGIVL